MSRGPGIIGRKILELLDEPPVWISPSLLIQRVYGSSPLKKQPLAQRKAVVRAMRAFCSRSNQFQLAGGKGQMPLCMFDAADPVSVKLMELRTTATPERKPKRDAPFIANKRGRRVPEHRVRRPYVPINDAKRAVARIDPVYAAKWRAEREKEFTETLVANGLTPKAASRAAAVLLSRDEHSTP